MTNTHLYIKHDTVADGKQYTSGNAYLLSELDASQLIASGVAEVISLPTLNAIKQEATLQTDSYKAKRKEILHNPRFADNPAELNYQLAELEGETAKAMDEKDMHYKAELAALRIDSASRALDPVGDPAEIETARGKADSIVTQFLISSNPTDIFRMLDLAVKTMTIPEKVETLKRWGEISGYASSQDPETVNLVERIQKSLKTVENTHVTTLRHLAAVENSGSTASVDYRILKNVQGRK
ncbi:hypothetical protein ACFSFY_02500 [Sporosarcina siberiensis]|uniref:Uncharacterized protein n=1 Tax=Sporosarcina siberiensis TaxID=1365606 RepID=A0ABW4SCE4_9BACL